MATLDAWLAAKTAALERELSQEAQSEGLVKEGAVITVKLEVCDPGADIPRIEFSMWSLVRAQYIPVRPAVFSPTERDALLRRLQNPVVREALTELLVAHKNQPTRAGALNIRDNANYFFQYLVSPCYRLLVSKSGQWQLWEVRNKGLGE